MAEEIHENFNKELFEVPEVITFQMVDGKELKLDLRRIDVQFKTASNTVFASKDYYQSTYNILEIIENLQKNDSLYVYTQLKEGLTASSTEDTVRTYLLRPDKIAYVRVKHPEPEKHNEKEDFGQEQEVDIVHENEVQTEQ